MRKRFFFFVCFCIDAKQQIWAKKIKIKKTALKAVWSFNEQERKKEFKKNHTSPLANIHVVYDSPVAKWQINNINDHQHKYKVFYFSLKQGCSYWLFLSSIILLINQWIGGKKV